MATVILDVLLIMYSTIEPKHDTSFKNINIIAVKLIDGLCLYLLGFFIIKKAGYKQGNQHEWLLGLKIIWVISLVLEASFLISLIFTKIKSSKKNTTKSMCENIFNNSKDQCGNPISLINSIG